MTRPDQVVIAAGDAERTAYVLDTVRTTLRANDQLRGDGSNLSGLRVLDLACRTGSFCLAFAQAGAHVLGVEGKQGNLNRAQQHSNITYEKADVRDLVHTVDAQIVRSSLTPDRFDVTLCLGILYHLDAEDAIKLLSDMRVVTDGFAIVDTHVGSPINSVLVGGTPYQGWWYDEPESDDETLWSSVANTRSFWFDDKSLVMACHAAGWKSVTQLDGVRFTGEPAGRRWLKLS